MDDNLENLFFTEIFYAVARMLIKIDGKARYSSNGAIRKTVYLLEIL